MQLISNSDVFIATEITFLGHYFFIQQQIAFWQKAYVKNHHHYEVLQIRKTLVKS